MADRPIPQSLTSTLRRSLGRWMTSTVIGCAAISAGSGCSMMSNVGRLVTQHEGLDDFIIGHRNSAWAAKSWHKNKHRFCNQPHYADFEAGYRAGYIEVASGGYGCTPTMAPREYWGWKYQSPEGQAKVSAWFAGFPHGARAAEEDGLGNWNSIRTTASSAPNCGTNCAPSPVGPEGTPITPVPESAVGPEVHAVPASGGSPTVRTVPGLIRGPSNPQSQNIQGTAVATPGGPIDLSGIPRVPASSVPTVATGRTGS